MSVNGEPTCKEKYGSIHEAIRAFTACVKMQNSSSISACRPRPRVHAAFLHLQCANRSFWPLVSKYKTSNVFYFLHQNKTLRFIAHQRPRSEEREKKKSIKKSLCSTRRDFINNGPIRAKLRKKFLIVYGTKSRRVEYRSRQFPRLFFAMKGGKTRLSTRINFY